MVKTPCIQPRIPLIWTLLKSRYDIVLLQGVLTLPIMVQDILASIPRAALGQLASLLKGVELRQVSRL